MAMAHKAYILLGFLVILLSIVSFVKGTQDDRICPHHGVNYRGRCFWFVSYRTTWFEAGRLCKHLYGDHVTLVTIKDRETNEFIGNSSSPTLWIGLHEAHGENQWRWVDNTEPANGNYRNWEVNAPGTNPGTCAVISFRTDLWRNVECLRMNEFVCAELPSAPMCPNNGIFFRDRCYWRGTDHLPWAAANQACQDEFGPEVRLAVARDAEVNLFLSRLASSHVWLGLSDKERENVWKWVDGEPLEYSNWAQREPNNQNNEDCGAILFPDSQWNDAPCGDPIPPRNTITNRLLYICAIPPCSEMDGSGSVSGDDQDIEITDSIICTRTECTQHCVAGGACNATGQCMCIRQFPEMTCNIDEWKVELENEMVNTTTGGSLTLKCKVNLPVDHILSLSWTKCIPGYLPEYRTTITDVFSQGYSTLHISDVGIEDAGAYDCKVIFRFKSGRSGVTIPVTRRALVNITEASTPISTTKQTSKRTTNEEASTTTPTTKPNTERISTKEAQTSLPTTKPTTTERTTTKGKESLKCSTYQPARGATAVLVILLIMTTLLIVTVVVLMIKMKRMKRFGDGRLMELQDGL